MKRKLSRGDIQQLHALGAMKDKGILNQDEFAAQKGLLLECAENPAKPGRPLIWLAGAAAVLVLIAAAFGSAYGGSAAHEVGKAALSSQH